MRKIEERIVRSMYGEGRTGALSVRDRVDSYGSSPFSTGAEVCFKVYRLFGNAIAMRDLSLASVRIRASVVSQTTQSRLNALLSGSGYELHRRGRRMYLCSASAFTVRVPTGEVITAGWTARIGRMHCCFLFGRFAYEVPLDGRRTVIILKDLLASPADYYAGDVLRAWEAAE